MRLSSSGLWNGSFLPPAFYTRVPTVSTFLLRPSSLFLDHYTVYKFRIKPWSPYTIIIFGPYVLLSLLVSKVRNNVCVRVQHSLPKVSTLLTIRTADSVCGPRGKKLPCPPPPAPARVDRLKMFTPNRKDWFSITVGLGLGLKRLICKIYN